MWVSLYEDYVRNGVITKTTGYPCTVGGRYENYRTPEQEVPDKPLPYAWETCMCMASGKKAPPPRPST